MLAKTQRTNSAALKVSDEERFFSKLRMLCSCWAGHMQTMCYSWPQRDGDLKKQEGINGGKNSEGVTEYANEHKYN